MFLGRLTLQDPFQFFYFFRQERCSKTSKKRGVASGTLLTPASAEMSNGRNGMVAEFSVIGPLKCYRKGTWFVIQSQKFLNYVTDSLKISSSKDLIRVKSKSFVRVLDSYLTALNETVQSSDVI